MRRATRRVPAEDLREAAPRANIAFRSGDAIQAAPVAFRFQAGRYWIGIPRTETRPMLGPGEAEQHGARGSKLHWESALWWFQLYGGRDWAA